MKNCRFCSNPLPQEDAVCPLCAYDPKTDTINKTALEAQAKDPARKKLMKKAASKEGYDAGISPGVKKFMFIGLAVVIFSIFYKYSFNAGAVFSEFSFFFSRLASGKLTIGSLFHQEKQETPVEWININLFTASEKVGDKSDLVVEGISFSPDAASMAVINGKVFYEGESSEGVTVKRIERSLVEAEVDGEARILRLAP